MYFTEGWALRDIFKDVCLYLTIGADVVWLETEKCDW